MNSCEFKERDLKRLLIRIDVLEAELALARKEIELDNKLLAARDAVIAMIPECPQHGPGCLPHAAEWIEAKK